jgi:hypothetical protein
MSRLEAIEGEVQQRSADELKRFRELVFSVRGRRMGPLIQGRRTRREKAIRDDDAEYDRLTG